MSLDVCLERELTTEAIRCPVYDHGHKAGEKIELYTANITHNLNKMAEAAGIYKHLWRPEEIGISRAVQLVEPLREGLARLRADPAGFEQYNAPNGWGMYKHFVPFVEVLLDACERYPDALVSVSR